ncbi:hypothetical protein A2335_02505, partial [Candidatus Peregrinibacteria bacterium RIFOXYB2_FULL_32_7]
MKITIIGTGYVGLTTGISFAEMGNNVLCIDIDQVKIKNLQKGKSAIYEPNLENLLKKNLKAKRISFDTNIKKGIEFGDIIICAVGTPINNGNKADLTYVKEVAKNFGKYLNGYKIFLNKSTVPIGTSQKCIEIIKSQITNHLPDTNVIQAGESRITCPTQMSFRRANHDFDFVSNPEFLREGTAIKDTLNPDRIVIGINNQKVLKTIKKLYEPILKKKIPLVATSIESAEMIKYASNTFLATKISFINEIAKFCDVAKANIQDVAKGIGLDKRIGEGFLNAGIGYGGSCLPKDVHAFINCAKQHQINLKIIKAVKDTNNEQKIFLIKKLIKIYPNLKNKKIAIWGLSFKPETND